MKLFSIIIPVYNGEKFILRSLTSVINQEISDYEIIVVNDGSTDQTENIVSSFRKEQNIKDIILITKENGGLSDARNAGLKIATGKYIIWLDADDALPEKSLNTLYYATQKNPDIIVNSISSFYEESGIISEKRYTFRTKKCFVTRNDAIKTIVHTKGFWYSAWSFVTKRDFLLNNNLMFEKGIYHEDELWSPQIICSGHDFFFNNNSCYINTSNRAGSITTGKNIKKAFDKLFVCEKLKFLSLEINDSVLKRFLLRRVFFNLMSVYLTKKDYINDERFVGMISEFKKITKMSFGMFAPLVRLLFFIAKVLKRNQL